MDYDSRTYILYLLGFIYIVCCHYDVEFGECRSALGVRKCDFGLRMS